MKSKIASHKISVLTLSLLLSACGGGSSDTASTNNTPTGTTDPAKEVAVSSKVLSTLALTNKAVKVASTGIKQSKLLSSARYKTTQTILCNGGGEQQITSSDFDASSGQMPTTFDFDVVFDNCLNRDNGYESFINGSLKMTLELNQNDPASAKSDYTFTISNAYFVENGSSGKSQRVDIKDYEVISTGNQNQTSMQIKGSFKESSCLNQWITVKTLSPIVMMTNNTCPTAGQLSMTMSQSTTTITYNSDQSIDIGGNGTSQHYDNCDDLKNISDANVCK